MKNTVSAKMPECERMATIRDKSQAIGEFLDWLAEEKGLRLYQRNGANFDRPYNRTEELLAEFFDIDLNKVEQERVDMLKELRTGHARDAGSLKP